MYCNDSTVLDKLTHFVISFAQHSTFVYFRISTVSVQINLLYIDLFETQNTSEEVLFRKVVWISEMLHCDIWFFDFSSE